MSSSKIIKSASKLDLSIINESNFIFLFTGKPIAVQIPAYPVPGAMSAVPVLGTAENPGPQNPESKASTNLIVNYLPQTLTEDALKNMFSAVGNVQSCKLIRDKNSGASLGYGFINFATTSEAEKAIQSMNGLPLNNKTIKVSYARPSSTAIKNANLYVANLPHQFTQNELEAMFRPYGTIITSKVLIDPDTGFGKGVGFVRFDKYSEAETAIAALNGSQLQAGGTPILVKFANPPKASGGITTTPVVTPPTTKRSNAYGGGAVGPMRHATANVRFTPMGTLPNTAAAMTAATMGNAAAVTAATMANPAAVTAATMGTPSALSLPSLPGLATQNCFCIFVYNLPETCEDSLLYQLFGPFGAVTSVNVIRDLPTGKCKRYGFVNMTNYEEACHAIMNLNGYMLGGKPLQVSFKTQKK